MKYRDLVSFEPIESVKVLRDAEDLEAARRDTETLVVSPRLAEQLTELILPNMNLDTAPDAKGMLVVANYGTGKTHLMSVVSSILEHAGAGRLGALGSGPGRQQRRSAAATG